MQCPTCKMELPSVGTIEFEGRALSVYQCDDCIVPWEFDGQEFHAALTFAVDSAGKFYDANTFEPLFLN